MKKNVNKNLIIILIILFVNIFTLNVYASVLPIIVDGKEYYYSDKDFFTDQEARAALNSGKVFSIYNEAKDRDEVRIQEVEEERQTGEKRMSDKDIIDEYATMYGWFKEIFAIAPEEDEGLKGFFNVSKVAIDLNTNAISSLEEWKKTTPYNVFIGCGLFFMFINFTISFYQNKMNNEAKTKEQVFNACFHLIVSMLLIFKALDIVIALFHFFGFVLESVINYKDAPVAEGTGNVESMTETVRKLLINVVRNSGADRKSTSIVGLVDVVVNGIKKTSMEVTYMLPYIAAICGKLGVFLALVKNSILMIMHAMVVPIGMYNVQDGLKNSSAIRNIKKIIGLAFTQSIIIVAMLATNGIMKFFAINAISQTDSNAFLIACFFAMLQIAKAVVINSGAAAVANSVFGV